MKTVVISDIHIGDDSPTCWYQKKYHEQYLINLLNWIVTNAKSTKTPIDRLIILGDLFDFWTYPPDQTPPTIDQILAANPNVFNAGGPLDKVMDALNGNVLYLHGNHDITLTQDDLNRIPSTNYKIKWVPDVYFDPSQDPFVYTHGHLYTMFNAPDPRYPAQLPVGHFVTRAISYMVQKKLATMPANSTAADLTDQGAPYGVDLISLIPDLANQIYEPSVTGFLLDHICTVTGMDPLTPIFMADGTVTDIGAVKMKYDGLWTCWAEQYSSTGSSMDELGMTVAAKAVVADYNGNYMPWFAQKVAIQKSAAGTIVGHTHHPKSGVEKALTKYLNNGFDCPAKPDIDAGKAQFNFTYVNGDANILQNWAVNNSGGTFMPFPASEPRDTIVYDPFMDYSCYVTIRNDSDCDLVKQSQRVISGEFIVPPPDTVPAHTTKMFWIQDLAGVRGAEGRVVYNQVGTGGRGTMFFKFGCPTLGFNNYAAGGDEFIANAQYAPLGPKPTRNVVPPQGHPLFVNFIVDKVPKQAPGWQPTSLLAQLVDAAGFLYDPTQDIIYSRMNPLQRHFGFAYGYDDYALSILSAVIHCEPIFFDYNGKHWMIELWKGQYGLETGGEVGVYTRPINPTGNVFYDNVFYPALDTLIGKRTQDSVPSHNLFYDCAADSDMLSMSYTLKKNGKKLFSRGPEKHWWLTGFMWGVYSEPEQLTMDISITCIDTNMTTAFTNALNAMGYQYSVSGSTVTFTFANPKTYQPIFADMNKLAAVRDRNIAIVKTYTDFHFPDNDPNTLTNVAFNVVLDHIAQYGETFFGPIVSLLAKSKNMDGAQLLNVLSKGFNMAIDDASYFVTQAGYTLASWTQSFEDALGLNLNYSCIGEISNKGGQFELIRDDFGSRYGDYVTLPPKRIKPGEVGRFWLKDPKPTIHGADGWVQYHYTDANKKLQTVRFHYDCATGLSDNDVTISGPGFNFYTKTVSATSGWSSQNQVIKGTGQHPLFIGFVWGNGAAPND